MSIEIHLNALFTSSNANEAEVCAVLCKKYKTKKTLKLKEALVHTGLTDDLEEMVQLVHFAERAGGKLATFTINLTANVSQAKVPCCAVFLLACQHHAAVALLDTVFVSLCRRSEEERH